MEEMTLALRAEALETRIFTLRGFRVMFSTDLAKLYGVQPKALMQAVSRNAERFPPDFMFKLSVEEAVSLKSQFVTSSWGGARKLPHAFTQEGVAMLSSVLRSPQAVRGNVEIMRAFVRLRMMLSEHRNLVGAGLLGEFDELQIAEASFLEDRARLGSPGPISGGLHNSRNPHFLHVS
jgi:hypothetical protein